MKTPSIQPPNVSQIKFSSASDCLTGSQNGMDSRPLTPRLIDPRVEGKDDDSHLIALGKEFKEIADRLQELYDPASPNDHLKLVEAALVCLEPIERAIMATPARTIAGLGVKARHAAHVMSEYWDAPIDQIDWEARAVRLLIEAVCERAGLSLPFGAAAP
jgi:hypothetical protein